MKNKYCTNDNGNKNYSDYYENENIHSKECGAEKQNERENTHTHKIII